MSDAITEHRPTTILAPPSLWKVVFHNDDETPMDFVTHVLKSLYNKNEEEALRLTLQVHEEGSATLGPYPRDIAQTKCLNTRVLAHEAHHPLLVVAEPA